MNKKQLAILLSALKTFEKQNVQLEQYPTEAEIAADVLWFAFLQGDIKGKTVADLGCGYGTLGVASLVLGAKKVFFVDIDKKAIALARTNVQIVEKLLGKRLSAVFLNKDIRQFKRKADVVVQNPPFGVKSIHMDKRFLLKAMETAPVIYSFHKMSTADFIKKLVTEHNFEIVNIKPYKLPLRRSLWFHKKRVRYVDVGCWKIKKK